MDMNITPIHMAVLLAETVGGCRRSRLMNLADNMPAVRGELLAAEPLARHTSWRVGGPARQFFKPADADDLAMFLSLPWNESMGLVLY